MKQGYHSTQNKMFGTIPMSEWRGLVVGFAVGLILSELLPQESSVVVQLIGAAGGFAVGWWYDGKYYAEKDVEIELLASQDGTESTPSE